ncbi:hypothetical protein Q765_00180 [Flavobacterium rivuli WB 3.3-2 = DSM 21788]|uniref:Uncharacterized protein n=1 Tax=Flavobacterium rivuli WB 3.3-2 = DSM 21788 TaxID=1121895 RepID=A0A0A2MA83_9FLAO|nr:hypothetical protein [Flavobacterium rivuli]KGO88373.1 hypothetical protein Q765_00180 [Flavobacterium rivuli WB 3.3-2 = DSM 21788]
MQTITANQGQNFKDLVIKATGDVANLIVMAAANDVSPTATPVVGRVYIVAGTIKKSISELFTNNDTPATLFIDTERPVTNLYGFPETFPFL